MVRRQLALAGEPVHEAPPDAVHQRLGHVREVDAHAAVLVEVAAAVVPVGEQLFLGVQDAEPVDEAPVAQLGDRGAFGLGDVRVADERLRRPQVAVLGRDVEVAHHHDRVAGLVRGGDPVVEAFEPRQLALVELGADLAAVGHVHADHAHAAAHRGEEAGVALVRVDELGAVEPGGDVGDAGAGQDRHAVPLPGPVVHRVVPEALEGQLRERVVGELGLLEAQDVGLGVLQPLLDPGEAGLQRVDVPGGEAHSILEPTRRRRRGSPGSRPGASPARTRGRRRRTSSRRSSSGPVPDAARQLRRQRGDVGVVAEERAEPGALGGVELGAEAHLAFEHPERVDRDAAVELHPALDRRHHVPFEELADRLEQLGGRGSILHVRHHPPPSIRSSRSHSISATRRPSVASSTERTVPSRCVNAWISQITPHFSVPIASQ